MVLGQKIVIWTRDWLLILPKVWDNFAKATHENYSSFSLGCACTISLVLSGLNMPSKMFMLQKFYLNPSQTSLN